MFMIWVYPLILVLLVALSLFSKRRQRGDILSLPKQTLLSFVFLLPWFSLLYFRNSDMWMVACQILLAAVLLISRSPFTSPEAWYKLALSSFLGLIFLGLSLHPSLGLPFIISTEIAQSIATASFLVSLFLFFGLPPLQLGVIDAASQKSEGSLIFLSLATRFCLAFVILMMMSQSRWIDGLIPLHGFSAGVLIIALALSRLVLRLQSDIKRTLAYLMSSTILGVVVKLTYPEYGEIVLCLVVMMSVPFFLFLDQSIPLSPQVNDLGNWTDFEQHHPTAKARFLSWMKIYLYLECIGLFIFALLLFFTMQWPLGLCALFGSLCSLAVNLDPHAFAVRSKALA